jgi:PAS domain S-box-containing protein
VKQEERLQIDITERMLAAEALRRERDFAEGLVDTAQTIVLVLNTQGCIVRFNPYMEEISGYALAEVQGLDWFTTFLPESVRERTHNLFLKAIGGIQTRSNVNQIVTKDGSVREIEWYDKTLKDDQGNVVGLLATGQDITERKRAEEQLRFQAALLANVNDAIIASDSQYRLTAWNPAAEALYGWKAEEVLGRNGLEITRTEWPGVEAEVMRRTIAEAKQWRGEATQARRDGTRFPVEVSTIVLHDESGQITGYISVNHDITKRIRTEQALRESEAKYRTLVENIPQKIFMKDRESKYLSINENFARDLGIQPADIVGKTDYDFYPKDLAEHYRAVDLSILETGQTEELEEKLMQEGRETWIHAIKTPVRDENGEIVAVLGVFWDITSRKQAEIEIQNLARFPSENPNPILRIARDGTLLYMNEACLHQLPEWRLQVGQVVPPMLREIVFQSMENGTSKELDLDHGERVYSFFVVPIVAAGYANLYGINITKRKQVEEALRESEQKYRLLVDNASETIIVAQDGILKFVNRIASDLSGYSDQELTSRPFSEFIHPDDRSMVRERHLSRIKGDKVQPRYVFRLMARNGKIKWVEIDAIMIDWEGKPATLNFLTDITERKRSEESLKRSRKQLRALANYLQSAIEAERTNIAREIHDELSQSMTAIKMDLNWLANRLPEGDERFERIHGMDALVNSSIALMRRIATELRPNLLDDLGLNAALDWQAREFSRRSGVPCKLNLPKDDLTHDPAFNTTLYRIFQETLTNVYRHAQATCVNASLQQKGKTLILTIHDNGVGIQEIELNNPRSLGLLSLRERALQWGGKTTIHGASGKGTTVTARIPLPASLVNGGG